MSSSDVITVTQMHVLQNAKLCKSISDTRSGHPSDCVEIVDGSMREREMESKKRNTPKGANTSCTSTLLLLFALFWIFATGQDACVELQVISYGALMLHVLHSKMQNV
jgi:hypothetical protein